MKIIYEMDGLAEVRLGVKWVFVVLEVGRGHSKLAFKAYRCSPALLLSDFLCM